MFQKLLFTDDELLGLYWVLELARTQRDGVVIQNSCLQCMFHVDRVHEDRALAFAKKVRHYFPFAELGKDPKNNGNMLILGLNKEPPVNPMGVWNIPECETIMKALGKSNRAIPVGETRG